MSSNNITIFPGKKPSSKEALQRLVKDTREMSVSHSMVARVSPYLRGIKSVNNIYVPLEFRKSA